MDYQHLQQNIGYTENVEFSLYRGPWEYTKTYNHRDHEIKVMRHTGEQMQFIASVFDRLDELIDLDFRQVESDQIGDIRIFRAYENSDWDSSWSDPDRFGGGKMYGQSEGIDLEWRDIYASDEFKETEKSTIVHEIAHALGLSHPGDVGANPNWDEWDSIMSYNNRLGVDEEPIWFTDLDIQALQSIWGVEANDNPALTGTKAVLANGTEDTQYSLSKSALLQGFSDIDSATLTIGSVQSSAGTINDTGNGTLILTPPKDFNGEVSLSYTVSDGMGGSIAGSNSIDIISVNDQPLLTSSQASLKNGKEDQIYFISEATLLQGFTDIDSSALTIESLSSSVGSIAKNGNGSFALNTPRDFNGRVALSYKVADGMGGLASASNIIYFENMPDGIVRRGSKNNNKLVGGKFDDTLLGKGGTDKLIGKNGNDIIDAGRHGGKAEVVKGGKGSYTFIIKEGYWLNIKDFKVVEDVLNLNGLANGLAWDYQDGKTYIWGEDGYEVARFKGYKNLDQANLV